MLLAGLITPVAIAAVFRAPPGDAVTWVVAALLACKKDQPEEEAEPERESAAEADEEPEPQESSQMDRLLDELEEAPAPLNVDYLKGLNFLLNEQTDQALEHFLKMVRVDDKTIETHFALGSLFRRRGEVGRAIRFHQNIIAKPGLKPEQRTQALLELGEDYMRAGLLDRAERLFAELIETDSHTPAALHSLLEIYQQEKDWEKALDYFIESFTQTHIEGHLM